MDVDVDVDVDVDEDEDEDEDMGVDVQPDWAMAAQAAPDYEVDQRTTC